jgi:di/tricarboxylate transporter
MGALSPQFTHYVMLIAMMAIVAGLFIRKFKPTGVFVVVVLLLAILGIIPLKHVLVNMANDSVITIFLLIFITSSLRKHFNLLGKFDRIFKSIKSPRTFMLAFTSLVAGISSMINNTPIVAVFIPYVYSWAKKRKISPSKFLIPLSYAATLGGTITLIGTSTNLVLNGLMTANGFEPLAFTDFLIPGLLVTGAGILLMFLFGLYLMPERSDLMELFEQGRRNFIVETKLAEGSRIIGKKVSEAGLRNLEDLFLVEIYRNGQLISPVNPNEVLELGDLLYFAGETSKVTELISNPDFGLIFPKTDKFQLGKELDLVEALVPAMSDLGGVKVRESDFRERYDAAIVAIQRHGEKLGGKIGSQVLEFGDLLLLTAGKKFKDKVRADKNLISLSYKEKLGEEKTWEKKVFGYVMISVMICWIAGILSLLMGLVLIQTVLLALKLSTFDELKKQFNVDLFLILVGAITFGTAMLDTGTASWFVELSQSSLSGMPGWFVALSLFLITLFLTSFVTNVAAVSIAFPIAAALLPQTGLPEKDVFLLIAFAASCSFLTPVSYQTNLMVYEPGGYKATDFLSIGVPLTILYTLICTAYFL